MNKNTVLFISFVVGIFTSLLCVIVGSITFWLLGMLFCYIFRIPYNWTFMHGCLINVMFLLLLAIVRGGTYGR